MNQACHKITNLVSAKTLHSNSKIARRKGRKIFSFQGRINRWMEGVQPIILFEKFAHGKFYEVVFKIGKVKILFYGSNVKFFVL